MIMLKKLTCHVLIQNYRSWLKPSLGKILAASLCKLRRKKRRYLSTLKDAADQHKNERATHFRTKI